MADTIGRVLGAAFFLAVAAIGVTFVLSVLLSVIWFIRWLP